MIQHIAFIMDGNRRWAKEKKLPTLTGHAKGFARIEQVIDHAQSRGIKHVTFYAFSTENWNRDQKEITYLINLFRKLFAGRLVKKLLKKGGKITILGDMSAFPTDLQDSTKKLIEDSKDNTGMHINIALNYGGRAEIVQAVQQIISKEIKSTDITADLISQHLYTKNQPDPDLIVRTSGEHRLSGYLPWQSVYSELYFPEVYWPDFDTKELDKALEEYEKRQRRFGK
jgi:undecaprenyl diphosphate synthase